MIPIEYVLVFSLLLLVSFIGGWHTASRNCRQVAENYGKLLGEVDMLRKQYEKLLSEHMAVKGHYYALQSKYDTAIQEIARLSANWDALQANDCE